MKYCSFNEQGLITGFFDDEIHSSIPLSSRQLIETEWQDCVKNQGLYRINVSTKELFFTSPLPPVISAPNWKAFRNIILTDTGYESIANSTTKLRGLARFENELMLACINQSNREAIKKYWDEAVSGINVKPLASRIDSWNAAATQANLGISFAADGKMILM